MSKSGRVDSLCFDPIMPMERLRSITWFADIDSDGARPSTSVQTLRVTLTEGIRLLDGAEWENRTLDGFNDLHASIKLTCTTDYRHWNDSVRQVKPEVLQIVDGPAITLGESLGQVDRIVNDVRWNALAIVMELGLSACDPPPFFRELLAVYEAGHLPCSWPDKSPLTYA